MQTITIDDVMAWGPCEGYPRERIEKIGGGRSEMSAMEILDLGEVHAADRVWVVLHGACLDDSDRYLLAAAFAEICLPVWEHLYPYNVRPHNGIRALRLYALGEVNLIEMDEILVISIVDAWYLAWRTAIDCVDIMGDNEYDSAWDEILATMRQYLMQKEWEKQ